MKIIPYGMTFEQALRAGYTGRIECRPYLDWIKTLPCDTCGRHGTDGNPIDPSHLNSRKGMGTKAPDLFSIPQCRRDHELYERDAVPSLSSPEEFMARAALYLLQAFFEGRLIWRV